MNEEKELKINSTEEVVQEEQKETYKEMSPIKLILRRFFRSKLSLVGIILIVFLFAFSFLGPLFYNSDTREAFGFEQAVYFEADEASSEVPNVSFE